MNTTPRDTPANRSAQERLERALADLLREALQRGFHGHAGLEFVVQDGVVQSIRRRVERVER